VSVIRVGQTAQCLVGPAPTQYAAEHAAGSVRDKDEPDLECVIVILISEEPRGRIREGGRESAKQP
jgi:hypothetical protein